MSFVTFVRATFVTNVAFAREAQKRFTPLFYRHRNLASHAKATIVTKVRTALFLRRLPGVSPHDGSMEEKSL